MTSEHPYSYLQNAKEATLRLQTEINDNIQKTGPLPFSDFMHLCLYHQNYGYYTRGHEAVGKSGDFFTSVSVGKTFGTILAHRIYHEWMQQSQPSTFHLIELGANTGQLAKDILDTILHSFPELYSACSYHIVEHLERVKTTQSTTLSEHLDVLSHHDSLEKIGNHGVLLSNELIDAFPADLYQFQDGAWHQRMVSLDGDGQFTFTLALTNAENSDAVKAISSVLPDAPEGYQTEYRSNIQSFVQAARNALTHALVITIDYGHTMSSYYAASRKTGTLRCYHQHQADENPLAQPGLKDITAHVNFTQLGQLMRSSGFKLTHFSSQSHYLTTHGAEWLKGMEQDGTLDFKLIRQFQTLTHPTTMGHQFHILEAHTHREEHSDTLEKLEL